MAQSECGRWIPARNFESSTESEVDHDHWSRAASDQIPVGKMTLDANAFPGILEKRQRVVKKEPPDGSCVLLCVVVLIFVIAVCKLWG